MNGGGEEGSLVSPLIAAAHELKAPLALVRQLALRLENDTLTETQRHRLLEQTILTSERALRLTGDLTKAARLEDALFELEPINPEQLCRDVVSELSSLFEAYGRQLEVKTRKHPLLLVANRDLLRRILLSFSDNALHYSQPGSAVRLQVQALKKASIIRVGVRDYGPALSNDMWRTLQKKLGTAPQTVHARPESSGLGLYIAGQFAEVMNGTIGALRHKDGATFYIDLQASTQLSLL
ncbi:MAG TPA: HAMP domain-containing sensor histidine kinase [Dongiaceae bacterium]|nr:HAMP domain-containing sensor histidine kinase [Dongiaceae bacterium]